jgi:hypothetical protein
MVERGNNDRQQTPAVTREDVERVLAVGRLLLSVLTTEELDRLRDCLATGKPFRIDDTQSTREKGNAGVS